MREEFLKLCQIGFKERGVLDKAHAARFVQEHAEIAAQDEYEYYVDLYQKFRKDNLKFERNQWNNLVDYLLFLTDEFDINKPSAYIEGEFPDIDLDFHKEVRDYLKRDYIPRTFHQENVCEIGTYSTSGLKSSILDMAKIYDADKPRVQAITKMMSDKFKDDEGNTRELSWDDALRLYPDFAQYCKEYPEVASAAKLLLDRVRSCGVHAAGLIISSKPIADFVPLEKRLVTKDNPEGVVCSAWTEGLNRQDLGPVGLIKFDYLVISNLNQIAVASHLVKTRHGLPSICALPGQWDFSDVSYLNDPKALSLANNGHLMGIFQFDSAGIRNLVKKGGVTRFDDLCVYSSIYRPGPLNCLREDTRIVIRSGEKSIGDLKSGVDKLAYLRGDGKLSYTNSFILSKTGKKKLVKVTTKSGRILFLSKDHRVLVGDKYVQGKDLKVGDKVTVIK